MCTKIFPIILFFILAGLSAHSVDGFGTKHFEHLSDSGPLDSNQIASYTLGGATLDDRNLSGFGKGTLGEADSLKKNVGKRPIVGEKPWKSALKKVSAANSDLESYMVPLLTNAKIGAPENELIESACRKIIRLSLSSDVLQLTSSEPKALKGFDLITSQEIYFGHLLEWARENHIKYPDNSKLFPPLSAASILSFYSPLGTLLLSGFRLEHPKRLSMIQFTMRKLQDFLTTNSTAVLNMKKGVAGILEKLAKIEGASVPQNSPEENLGKKKSVDFVTSNSSDDEVFLEIFYIPHGSPKGIGKMLPNLPPEERGEWSEVSERIRKENEERESRKEMAVSEVSKKAEELANGTNCSIPQRVAVQHELNEISDNLEDEAT